MTFLSDNHDAHPKRGRSCSKYINSAEIHAAEIEAMEETAFGSLPSQSSSLVFKLLGI